MLRSKVVFLRQRAAEDANIIRGESDWNIGSSPHSEVVVRVSSRDHLGVDIAAQAELNANVLFLDDVAKFFFDLYDMAKSIGLPGEKCL